MDLLAFPASIAPIRSSKERLPDFLDLSSLTSSFLGILGIFAILEIVLGLTSFLINDSSFIL